MANAAQSAPKLKLGQLSPEEAERLAASFRPIWELDDAPFAQGNGLSAADIDALSAGAGIAQSVRGTEQKNAATFEARPVPAPTPGHVPAPDAPKVEIAVDIEMHTEVTPPPPQVAQAAPQVAPQASSQAPTVARKPYTPPRPPPAPVKMSRADASADFVPVKKSNTGIILAVVGVLVIVGGIFGVRSMMNSTKTSTASTASTSEPTQEKTNIPPPPDTAAAAATQQTTQPADTHQAAPPPPAETDTEAPAPTHHASAPPPPTHVAVAHTAPPPTHATTHAAPHPHTGGHAAIVRDNPF